MISREQKLEQAVKAALRLRKSMRDVAAVSPMLFVPKEEVVEFDRVINELTERK